MAFTASERLQICEIVGITPDALNSQIVFLGDRLTADIEDAVRTKITAWGPASAGGASFTPTESNRGMNLDADSRAEKIADTIALWLEIPKTSRTGGVTVQWYQERG